jgi:hypothetical protein
LRAPFAQARCSSAECSLSTSKPSAAPPLGKVYFFERGGVAASRSHSFLEISEQNAGSGIKASLFTDAEGDHGAFYDLVQLANDQTPTVHSCSLSFAPARLTASTQNRKTALVGHFIFDVAIIELSGDEHAEINEAFVPRPIDLAGSMFASPGRDDLTEKMRSSSVILASPSAEFRAEPLPISNVSFLDLLEGYKQISG